MQQEDKTIETKLVQNDPPRYQLYSKMKCEILSELLSDIQFEFGELMITISPKDYLIEVQDQCQIALQTSSDDSRHVRLGTYFLKNSFVQLDYDSNIIVMGSKESVKNILMEDDEEPSDDGKVKPAEPTKPTDDKPEEPEEKPTQPDHDDDDNHDQGQDDNDKPADDQHFGKPGENPNPDDDNDKPADPSEPDHTDEPSGGDDQHEEPSKPEDNDKPEPETPSEPEQPSDGGDDNKPSDEPSE